MKKNITTFNFRLSGLHLLLLLLTITGSGIMFASADAVQAPHSAMENSKPTEKQATSPANEKPIVILGASYAAGLNVDQLAGRRVINKGIGGEQSFEMLARFEQDVLPLNPEMVIIWGFINDIFRSDRNNMPETLERIKASYQEMISLAHSNGIRPILVTEVTMSLQPGFKAKIQAFIGKLRGKKSYQEDINSHVMAINRWLQDYAAENGTLLIDIQTQLAGQSGMRKKIYAQEDGSHISEEGYSVITSVLKDALQPTN